MTAATVSELLRDTTTILRTLMRGYESIWREQQATDEAMAEFALFLSSRERQTITALEGYLERDEDLAALDVHLRLGAGFPFSADDLRLPLRPTTEGLQALGERTDTLLELLGERISVYAASGDLGDVLHALDELVGARRRGLAAALNELETHQPSPKPVHGRRPR